MQELTSEQIKEFLTLAREGATVADLIRLTLRQARDLERQKNELLVLAATNDGHAELYHDLHKMLDEAGFTHPNPAVGVGFSLKAALTELTQLRATVARVQALADTWAPDDTGWVLADDYHYGQAVKRALHSPKHDVEVR